VSFAPFLTGVTLGKTKRNSDAFMIGSGMYHEGHEAPFGLHKEGFKPKPLSRAQPVSKCAPPKE